MSNRPLSPLSCMIQYQMEYVVAFHLKQRPVVAFHWQFPVQYFGHFSTHNPPGLICFVPILYQYPR